MSSYRQTEHRFAEGSRVCLDDNEACCGTVMRVFSDGDFDPDFPDCDEVVSDRFENRGEYQDLIDRSLAAVAESTSA